MPKRKRIYPKLTLNILCNIGHLLLHTSTYISNISSIPFDLDSILYPPP
ncbi:MAG: hypothetical protein K2P17_00140 [Helicobacteraceae bacterium]|nr:hypothetical protein [Helicobacteraceae bacterium]